MPIWKGRKKKEPHERIMYCPDCLKPGLRYASLGGGVFGQPRLLCPHCGYRGVVYVDVNPNSQNDDELERELVEENPDFLASRKSAKTLACESLQSKWIPKQSQNTHTLRSWCPFCADVQVVCGICQCPPEICANQASEGLIGQLNNLYDDEDTLLSTVDSEIYEQIVEGFQKLCEK